MGAGKRRVPYHHRMAQMIARGVGRVASRLLVAAAVCVGAASPGARAAEFALDAAHTNVHFAVSHFDISYVRGRFGKVAGKIDFDAERKTGAIEAPGAARRTGFGRAARCRLLFWKARSVCLSEGARLARRCRPPSSQPTTPQVGADPVVHACSD